MKRRLLLSGGAALAATGLAGCGTAQIADYAGEKPQLDLRSYFNGTIDAYGVFTDRAGKVVKRFTVLMQCSWQGPRGEEEGVLDEDFLYSDGTRQKRIWLLKRQPGAAGQGRYTGRAGDVVGEATGEERGNAFYWTYTLSLPLEGRVIEVQFDDWMYLMNDKVMLNRATMSKWGVRLGEVTLSFSKR
ncbi:MAG: DUF3833 domain-containing protein [Gammaproteobacteria bacterium]|nr:DUF3833 domain-containing protein [Gammaproteobacteria bacterium]MBU0785599.1 DUF3833 domain-containing protein [Gammaproteobacteria bacterium]MBU0816888.1 DUF3833 domain-containing protein [Gammaproteobacteria bacterium]MBU1787052.1 DUF3833 domain-containing protein [Gammaproteobacteria bacterium]